MIKLEVGKSYTTRGGWEATVVTKEDDDRDCFNVTHSTPDGQTWIWHYANGQANVGGDYDLIAAWEDEVPEVDLTKIEKPFGLLDKDTQERLKAHGGPYQVFGKCGWDDTDCAWCFNLSYRVKPKPFVEYKTVSVTTGFSKVTYDITEKFVDGKYDSYTVDMVPF